MSRSRTSISIPRLRIGRHKVGSTAFRTRSFHSQAIVAALVTGSKASYLVEQ